MVKIPNRVIVIGALIAVLLSIPVTLSFLSDTKARTRWEQRSLATLPTMASLITEPKKAFGQVEDFVDDHFLGGLEMIKIRRRFLLAYLGVTNDPYIVRNGDSALFLTSAFYDKTRDNPFSWWELNCHALMEEPRFSDAMRKVVAFQRMFSQKGAEVSFGFVPSKSVVLSQSLPRATPADLKAQCQAITPQNNWINKLDNLSLPDISLFYPLELFRQRAASSPLFFPDSSYHWGGESTWAFATELAKFLKIEQPRIFQNMTCVPGKIDWDIGRLLGVHTLTDGCVRDIDATELTETKFEYDVKLPNGETKKLVLFGTENKANPNGPVGLIYTNSFGPPARLAMGSLFSKMIHFNQNPLKANEIEALIAQTDILEVDHVILLGADFHVVSIFNQLNFEDTGN